MGAAIVRSAWVSIVVVSIGACGDGASKPADAPVGDVGAGVLATPNACGPTHTAELEQRLRAACTTSRLATHDTKRLAIAKWPAKSTLPTQDDGVLVVSVEAAGMHALGRTVTHDELEDTIARDYDDARRSLERSGRTDAPTLVLAIDADVRLDVLQPVLVALSAQGVVTGQLLLASGTEPHTPPPPNREHYDRIATLIAAEPGQTSLVVARGIETLIEPCPPLQEAFRTIAVTDREGRCPLITSSIAAGLVACGCPAWEPEFLAYMDHLGPPADAPKPMGDPIQIVADAPLPADGATTWGEWIATRDASVGKLWFDLR